MPLDHITDLDQLRKINNALLNRVESAMDQQGNAFSLFQTAINLEGQVKRRTDELTSAIRKIENTNTELAQAKEASDRANLSKTKFLAAASHDVLQPLNAALLSISVLEDIQTCDLGRKLISQVERSLETMSELISTLIDISKLDAGVTDPRLEDFALCELMESLKSDFTPIAEDAGLKLRFAGIASYRVRSDRTMLRRILQNLVSNALRYTSKGGVLVGLRNRGNTIRIEVIDTGCGIPENQHENIFEEFNRGALPSGHQREANNGLGLGLSIVRRMTHALGHPLLMRSIVGSGTRFVLEVPVAETKEPSKSEFDKGKLLRADRSLSQKRVLFIENDLAAIDAMVLLLKSWKCDCLVASTVEETRRVLSDTDWVPDVIVADQHLDYGDLGTEAIRIAREFVGHQVPALLVTADPTAALERAVSGMDIEFMNKPVKPAQLRALLSHLTAG